MVLPPLHFQCFHPSHAVSYLHVTVELDVNGRAAVRCQEVRAVVGNNQVKQGMLLKQLQVDVEGPESKL